MMDVRTFPAAYEVFLNAAIAVALQDIARDAEARAKGEKPLIGFGFDASVAGTAIVAVSQVPSENRQLLESFWPDKPAADAARFPGYDLSLERQERKAS